jgi:DNA-binding response OmpR family regulator
MSVPAKSILLIDDDRQFVAVHKLLLQEAGYRVSGAYDGRSGLELARAEKPDLVILDIIMGSPEAGFELCRELRADESLKHSRLLVLSAVGRQFQMAFEPDSLWLPADRFLEKPVDAETLIAEVRGMLGQPDPRHAKTALPQER